jgi:GntR family carbon starvation induced transcriptional regulator
MIQNGAIFSEASCEVTLTDQAYRLLRRDILTAQAFKPMAHLALRALTQLYGIRATPLREALWALVGEGLVEAIPNLGFRVSRLRPERLRTLAILRQQIEPWALEVSIHTGGPDYLANVERAYAELDHIDALVGDMRLIDEPWEAAHSAFHRSLLSGCSERGILEQVQHWHDETNRFRRLSSPTLGGTAANKYDHDIIYAAVMSGDSNLAVVTLRNHIIETSTRHLSYFDAVTSVA